MPDFKPGDRVEYIGDTSRYMFGIKGTVSEYISWSNVRVDWDEERPYAPTGVFSTNIKLIQEMTMNTLQDSVFSYLTNGEGTTDMRKNALRDLIEKGVFSSYHTEGDVKELIGAYLDENPRGFCSEGINKFKSATVGVGERCFRIILEVPFTDLDEERYNDSHVADTIISAVSGLTTDRVKLGEAKWRDFHSREVTPNARLITCLGDAFDN